MASLWRVLYSLLCAFPWCASSLIKPAVHQSLLRPSTDQVGAVVIKPNGMGELRPFGVGIDLSSSYGTVSVKYANGSTFDIAKVEAEPAYASMLAKWSLISSQHLAPDHPSMDFTLGLDQVHSNPDAEYYWQAVKDTIWRGVLADNYAPHWPSEVFLFGESAKDPKFRAVLEEALIAITGGLPQIFGDYPVFQTARGAAEIARRGGFFRLWPR